MIMWLLPLLVVARASACVFSRSTLPKPASHPSTSAAGAFPMAPGVPYMDSWNSSVYPWAGYDLPSDSWFVPRAIANLSAQHSTALCYWSQQVLPSPPTGFDPSTGSCAPSPCAWTTPPSATDVKELYVLADQAIGAMQYMIGVSLRPGGIPAFVGSQCGSGASNIRVLCSVEPKNPICNATGLQQRSEWAVASNILAMTPDTLDAVFNNVTAWRTSGSLHIPAMTSALVSKGWGAGGAISFKVLPCSDVPAPLMGAAYGCNEVDPSSGSLVWDRAFAFWQGYKAPAWLREGLRALESAP
jgi:hypothetical protein